MNAPAPAATELIATLTRAAAALDAGDGEAASAAMEAAADLCRRLQTAGMGAPASELAALRDLYDRCGAALMRLNEQLNAASFRGEQQRRGMEAYQAHTNRIR